MAGLSPTLGEQLTENTFVPIILKRRLPMRGAYPIINREFASHALSGYAFVNREEDMGEEGLRKSKALLLSRNR